MGQSSSKRGNSDVEERLLDRVPSVDVEQNVGAAMNAPTDVVKKDHSSVNRLLALGKLFVFFLIYFILIIVFIF